ncbi:MAG: SMP-30/gluconolactonase/LRE family protein [Verrucomicrobiota bacterium]
MRYPRLLFLLVFFHLVVVRLFAGNFPETEDGFRAWNDVPFVTHDSGPLALDVIRPADNDVRAAVLCLHGGFWVKGDRSGMLPVAKDLARLGYVGVTSSYRLTGVAPFPAQLDDVRAAIRHLRENAKNYGIDPDRVGVIGSSAGGHLAMLSATHPDVEALERPNAAVGMGAQSDLTAPHLQSVSTGSNAENWRKLLGGVYFEDPAAFAEASPLDHLTPDDPPVALVAGELDHPSTRGERFRHAAFRLGIPTGLTVVPKAPHSLVGKPEHREPAVAAIKGFFDLYLGYGKSGSVAISIEATDGVELGLHAISEYWTRLGGGYNGCEGAQWWRPGEGAAPELIYAAHHDGLLFRWSEAKGLRLWEEGTPETSTVRPAKEGGFFAVEQSTRRLVRRDWPKNSVEICVEDFEGMRFNRPNDLRVHPVDGSIWFTDPNFLFRQRPLETQELPGQFVFRYMPGSSGGVLTAPIRDLSIPNGITFSKNGDELFIGDSKARTIFRYPVEETGGVGDPDRFATFGTGVDGLATAPDGAIWCALPDAVAILGPDGAERGRIHLPGRCTSIDFTQDGENYLVAVTTRQAAHVALFRYTQ